MKLNQRLVAWLKALTMIAGTILAVSPLIGGCVKDGDAGVQGTAGTPAAPPPTDPIIDEAQNLPGCNLVITGVSGGSAGGGNFQPGDVITATFTIKKNDGTNFPLAEMDSTGIWFSGPTFNYQHILPTGNTRSYTDVKTVAVQNSDSSYSYTFGAAIPTTFGAPFYDSAAYTAGELTGTNLLSSQGTYTVAMRVYKTFTIGSTGVTVRDVGNATKDILLGSAPGPLTAREVVKKENCNQCHVRVEGHGGGYRDTKLCVTCHTAGSEDSDNTATVEFKVMIHKIHNGAHLPSVNGVSTDGSGNRTYTGSGTGTPYTVAGDDFSHIQFPVWPSLTVAMPKNTGYSLLSTIAPPGGISPRTADDNIRFGVVACAKCHGAPVGGTAPAQGSQHETVPSRRACDSCHDDVVWANPYTKNGLTMPAAQTDANCSTMGCHTQTGTGISVREAHTHPFNNATLNPGIVTDVTAITGGGGFGGNFRPGIGATPGDGPIATFTLKNDAGTDIPLNSLDGDTSMVMGPTTNRQLVFPQTSTNGMSIASYDFSGRLHIASSSGRGAMSKVFPAGAPVSEILVVEFTSSTTFSVTGTVTGAMGAGTAFPAATSNLPASASVSGFVLTPAAVPQALTINFASSTSFTVTGSVTGVMGPAGTLPAATNASVRWTSGDGSVAFNVSVSAASFVATNNVYASVFRYTAGTDSLAFVVTAGGTAFSSTAPNPNRFYYEFVAAAPSYALRIPMEIVTEYLADGTGAVGQVLPAAANLPVYYGRQLLYEALAGAPATPTGAPVARFARYVDITPIVGFANNDLVVIEPAAAIGVREYVAVSPMKADGTGAGAADVTTRLYFKTPLRYAHLTGVTVSKATLTLRQEGAGNSYTIVPATGVITNVNTAFTAGRGVIITYRTDGRFGWKRDNTDTWQNLFTPPSNDSTDLGHETGDWGGLPFQDGTYSVNLYFTKTLQISGNGEQSTVTIASEAGMMDFLFGPTASVIVPHAIVPQGGISCESCHTEVMFHGGGRRSPDTCFFCHSVAAAEDLPRWNTATTGTPAAPTALTPGITIAFRNMLHKIHRGKDLVNAATYTVVGYQGTPHTYGEVGYPAMPGGVKHCDKCHGASTDWKEPGVRTHALQTLPTQRWKVVCTSCHDSSDVTGHVEIFTSGAGNESCGVCHGPGATYSVELMHKNR